MLHDPVHYDHLPYLPFPPGWPTFAPKDKLADWLEFYASALELNVWTSSTISAASFDEKTRSWSVTVVRPSGPRQLQPRHVVLATGHSGEPRMPVDLDLSPFAGDVICHSSAFCGAKRLAAGQRRKAVVVGCCNSAHDIAQSYFENGYDVTIVQRSSTYVMGSTNGMDVLMEGTYNENGVTIGLLQASETDAKLAQLMALVVVAPAGGCRRPLHVHPHPHIQAQPDWRDRRDRPAR